MIVMGRVMDPSGFEPEASALQGRRSTTELRARYYSDPMKIKEVLFDSINQIFSTNLL